MFNERTNLKGLINTIKKFFKDEPGAFCGA